MATIPTERDLLLHNKLCVMTKNTSHVKEKSGFEIAQD